MVNGMHGAKFCVGQSIVVGALVESIAGLQSLASGGGHEVVTAERQWN